jgi:hypothetical protein
MTREEIIKRQSEILQILQKELSDEDLQYLNFVIDNESRMGYWIANASTSDLNLQTSINQLKK